MANEQVTYVSSVENRYKKAKLNNVIQSLNCFVTCSSPDTTIQDYGYICYCGCIYEGQYIQGNKKPRRAGTPVIVNNTWLGTIDNNGYLRVENTCSSEASFVTSTGWKDISITFDPNAADNGASRYYCDSPVVSRNVTCTECCDDRGKYISEVTTTICCTHYHDCCYFCDVFPGISDLENSECWDKFKAGCECIRACCAWLWHYVGSPNCPAYPEISVCVYNSYAHNLTEAYTCYIWCDGATYYCIHYKACACAYRRQSSESPSSRFYRICVGVDTLLGPYNAGCWSDGHLTVSRLATTGISIPVCYCSYNSTCGWDCNPHTVCRGTVYKTLDKAVSSYAASCYGNVSVCTNPWCCYQFEVCRCIRPIEGAVCFCTRYY